MNGCRILLTLVFLPMAIGAFAQSERGSSAGASIASEVSTRAQSLGGTLFFNPQQRDRMDQARKRGAMLPEDDPLAEPPRSVVNGFVKRSDGQSAVWVDGQTRFNVRSAGMDVLQPSDVGGVSETVLTQAGRSSPASASRVKGAPHKMPAQKTTRKSRSRDGKPVK